MGGGGVMRSAMKVASVGVNGKLRGAPTVPLPEQSVSTVSRNKSRQVSNGILSSPAIEDGVSPVMLSSQNGKSERWEFDDWEFAEEELVSDSARPMNRVVFGGVPTLKEAEEATSDLKDILEMEYFPPKAQGYGNAASENMETYPSISRPAIRAFNLLKENAEAQSIVASLACDKNIWHCVMSNERVLQFIKSQATSSVPSFLEEELKPNDDQKFPESLDNKSDGKDSDDGSENVFAKLMLKLKITVDKMVSSFSELIQNFFGAAPVDVSEDASVSGANTLAERSMGNSIMALAVVVIVVLVMRRA